MMQMLRKLSARGRHWLKPAREKDTPRTFPWEPQQLIECNSTAAHNLTHIAAFTPKGSNAGDILLPAVLRDAVTTPFDGASWQSVQVREKVDRSVIGKLNSTDGVIIGGGGLFIRDTNPNEISGWQWACPTNLLKKINVPYCALAVGYNRFRGQPEFSPVFSENIRVFTENSVFVGLRNTGSINAIRTYLPDGLHDKIRFQPCFTTLCSRLYPELFSHPVDRSYISFNCAFDRPELRYRDNKDEILAAIVRGTERLSQYFGLPVRYFSHYKADDEMIPVAKGLGLDFEVVDLSQFNSREIIDTYRTPALAMGMRGHAQMIPFGCQTPILSLTSHDKLQWFLDDIKQPDWGVDLHDHGIADNIFDRGKAILESPEPTSNALELAQSRLWDVSESNILEFRDAVIRQ